MNLKANKKILFGMAFLFLFASALSQIAEPLTIIQIVSTSQNPKLVRPGDEFNQVIVLKNTAFQISAKNFSIEINPGNEFEVIGDKKQSVKEIQRNESISFSFRLKAKPGISAGIYTVSYKLKYSRGNILKEETRIETITVSDIYRVETQNVFVEPKKAIIGKPLKIQAEIVNTGTQTARNTKVELKLSGSNGFGNFATESDNQLEIGNLLPNESKKVEFELLPSRKTEPGIYSFSINASCLDCNEKSSEKVNIEVYGKTELFVSGIDYSVEGKNTKKILQGDSFSISIQLDNIGEEKAEAVIIKATTDKFLHGSKKSFVGTIDPEDSGAAVFDFFVDKNAPTGEHRIDFEISYLDAFDKKTKFKEGYSVFVGKTPKPGIESTLILVLLILIASYFVLKLVFRQIKLWKMK